MLRALAAVRTKADRDAVSSAVGAIYRSWLDAAAKALQAAIGPMANAHTYEPGPPASTAKGLVTVFVDGLRLDVAHRVQDRLVGAGLDVTATTSLAALPTVTQTAKPALVPTAKPRSVDRVAGRVRRGGRRSAFWGRRIGSVDVLIRSAPRRHWK